MRVMELKRRTLKYLCSPCEASLLKPTQVQSSSDMEQVNLNGSVNVQILQLENTIKNHIEHARSQILDSIQIITETNRDMVKLLSNSGTSNDNVQNQPYSRKMKINSNLPILNSSKPSELPRTVPANANKNVKSSTEEKRNFPKIPVKESVDNVTAENENGKSYKQKPVELSDEGYSTISYHRKNKQRNRFTAITGTGKGELPMVPVKLWFFVSRIHCSITEDSLLKYFEDQKEADYTVQWMTPKEKSYTYKSFKVGIPATLQEECKNSDFWPPGSLVNRFLFSKKSNAVNINSEIPKTNSESFLEKC